MVCLFMPFSFLQGQQAFYDQDTKNLLDSLENRIIALEKEIPRLAENRATNYFFAKRDLDFTIFLKHYHEYVFDEELDKAQDLAESRLKSVQKRGDKTAEDFYREYKKRINKEISEQQRRYQVLFEKEKTFKKEFYRFVNEGDEYSLKRAQRMTDLALKYALEKKLSSVYGYLFHYKSYINSLLYDYYSEYDLARLTKSETEFERYFLPLVESDSLDLIQQAGKLVDHCYNYSLNTSSSLDTMYFAQQKRMVASYISDYYDRDGSSEVFDRMKQTSLIARLDTLIQEGIYQWKDQIIVIGHFKPEADNKNVRKGEAILNADQRLLQYIRLNRLAKFDKELKMGQTFLIPYVNNKQLAEFMYNPSEKNYQYIVCYTKVDSDYFTRKLGQCLPPLQFGKRAESL
ncbi:MAG: hypothetical protein JXB24_07825 [Bacteroidales bacterium]|nr:hypothetical protein [Bacteroidales bacterium]